MSYRPPHPPPVPMQIQCNNREDPGREHNPTSAAREHGRATGALDMELREGSGEITATKTCIWWEEPV